MTYVSRPGALTFHQPMTRKLKRYLDHATVAQVREIIELGALLADPEAQFLLKRLAEPAKRNRRRAGSK